jgi:dynein heavy chain
VVVNLKELYDARSNANTPMLLLLTPGNDPMETIQRLAEERLRTRHPLQVSLGKGQAVRARALISEARQYGGWVVLQNCHLAPSFMGELAQVVDQLQPTAKTQSRQDAGSADPALELEGEPKVRPPHPEFRLWLTSLSCESLPQTILQASLKLTSEPPKGVRACLLRCYR